MSLTNLKRIARYRVRRANVSGEELVDYLKAWWSKKYQRPDNDPLLLAKYLEELVVEYHEDLFQNNTDQLNEFELSINEIHDDSDERWFKKVMGDQYTPVSAYSRGFKSASGESSKDVGFEDVYPTIGGGDVSGQTKHDQDRR